MCVSLILVVLFFIIIICVLYSVVNIFIKALLKQFWRSLQQMLQTPQVSIRFEWGERKAQYY